MRAKGPRQPKPAEVRQGWTLVCDSDSNQRASIGLHRNKSDSRLLHPEMLHKAVAVAQAQ